MSQVMCLKNYETTSDPIKEKKKEEQKRKPKTKNQKKKHMHKQQKLESQ